MIIRPWNVCLLVGIQALQSTDKVREDFPEKIPAKLNPKG